MGMLLSAVVACRASSPTAVRPALVPRPAASALAPAASPVATSALPRLWLRDSVVLDAPGGKEVFRPDAPMLVELMPDDCIRSVPGAPPAFAGFLPPETRDGPSDLHGLGLYAQHMGELHLGSASGPIIGRIFPGAYVGVVSFAPPTAVIVVPLFASPHGNAVRAHLDSAVLGPEPGPLVEPPPEGKLARDHHRGLAVEPEGDRFTSTLCGELRILAERPRSNGSGELLSQVAQRRDGVEIVAWTDQGISGVRGDVRCPSRFVWSEGTEFVLQDGPRQRKVAVPAVPPGFVRVPSGREDALAAALRGYAPVFWLVEGSSGATCVEWKPGGALVRGHDGSTSFEGRLERRETEGEDLIITSYTLSYSAFSPAGDTGHLVLLGPSTETRGLRDRALRSETGLLCGETYLTMAAQDDELTVIPGQSPQPIVAYHPDDAERWYLSSQACEAALVRARAAPDREALASLGLGFHRGC